MRLRRLGAMLVLLAGGCQTADGARGGQGSAPRLRLVGQQEASSNRCRLELSVPRNGAAARSTYLIDWASCAELRIIELGPGELDVNDVAASPRDTSALVANDDKGLLLVENRNGLVGSVLYVDRRGRVREVSIVD